MINGPIYIRYKPEVGVVPIEQFTEDDFRKYLNTEIVITEIDPDAHNFTGPELYQVVVHIGSWLADVIIGGLAWDYLKPRFVKLYMAAKQALLKRKQENIEDLNPCFVLVFDYADVTLHIEFSSQLNDQDIERALTILPAVLNPDNRRKVSLNKNYSLYLMLDEFPRKFESVLKYNSVTGFWEPQDFGDHAVKLKEFRRRMDSLSS